MKLGIQYQKELQIENIQKVGFSCLELPYDMCEDEVPMAVCGIVLQIKDLTTENFQAAFMQVQKREAEYLILDTQEVADSDILYTVIESNKEMIAASGAAIYIENGYCCSADGHYCCSEFSETWRLSELVDIFNQMCGKDCFGICLNVGYANLVGKNLRVMIEELGDKLGMIHINDNDGIHNQHQLPYTFTTGRGARSTDWYRIIGALVRSHFDGWLVFDTIGLFKRIPLQLQETMLKLLYQIKREWEEQFLLEQRLNQPEKKLILFGAGVMAKNYMDAWGDKYLPAFFVDNNSVLWDKKRFGIEIKSPEAILEIPEEQRNVWICNQYYDPIGAQLKQMRIAYQCYWDHYYL